MSDENENYCLFCFENIPAGQSVCPHCGHSESEPQSSIQQLPRGAILDGRYLIGRALGQGGFGITYLALDLNLRVRRAIKEYFPSGLVTRVGEKVTATTADNALYFQKGVEAFYREAQAVTKFGSHPNIIQIHAFFRENDTAYFVMEYVEGISLSEYLKQHGGRLSFDEALRLLLPIADALNELHKVQLLHRDVKPDNIYISKTGQPKLLDFGSARFETGAQTHSSAAVVTPGYAPPEQYSKRSGQGPFTDVYSLAATFYHVLTGVMPPEATDRLLEDELIPIENTGITIPPQAAAAIDHALIIKREERTQSISQFCSELLRGDISSPVPQAKLSGHPETVKTKVPRRTSARHKLLLTLAALTLCAGTALFVLKPFVGKKAADPTPSSPSQTQESVPSAQVVFSTKNVPERPTWTVPVQTLIFTKTPLPVKTIFPTDTDAPTTTSTVEPTETAIPTRTSLPLPLIIPTNTIRPTLTSTSTPTRTPHPTGTDTNTPLPKATDLPTITQTPTTQITPTQASESSQLKAPAVLLHRISAGPDHVVGLNSDGSVVSYGTTWNYCQRGIDGWENIISVAAGSKHTLGLKSDGTVTAAGETDRRWTWVSDWKDIVSVAAGGDQSFGIKSDGTVVTEGINNYGEMDVSDWTDIVDISTEYNRTMGLKKDGTVLIVGEVNSAWEKVKEWTDIIAISLGHTHAVGLKADGSVVAAGENGYGEMNVQDWTDIIAIAAGWANTLGLKKDGTIAAVGRNASGECDVSEWTDIIEISSNGGYYGSYSVGLKEDGSVLATGSNYYGPVITDSWKLLPDYSISTSDNDSSAASVSAAMQTGAEDIRDVDGMKMIYIPAGEFIMGTNEGEADEKPVRSVYIDAYWIDQTEVTNAQYEKCVTAKVCVIPLKINSATHSWYYGNPDFSDYPVLYVNWKQAQAYCKWAGGTLPTEAQWEKAARGTEGGTYPWGDEEIYAEKANYLESKIHDAVAVMSYQADRSPYGVYDTAGNVEEWTADWYSDIYYDKKENKNPVGPESGTFRSLRGGAYSFEPYSVRSASRMRSQPGDVYMNVGFRCISTRNDVNQADPSEFETKGKNIAVVDVPGDSGALLYTLGTSDSDILCSVVNGAQLELLGEKQTSHQIVYLKVKTEDGITGWIPKKQIREMN